MNNSRIKIKTKKGISLYFAVIVLSILLIIFLGLSALIVSQLKMTREMEKSVVALAAADTGIERTLYDFQCFYPITSLPNGATYTVEVVCNPDFITCPCPLELACDAPRYCIRSQGEFSNIRRKIEVKF